MLDLVLLQLALLALQSVLKTVQFALVLGPELFGFGIPGLFGFLPAAPLESLLALAHLGIQLEVRIVLEHHRRVVVQVVVELVLQRGVTLGCAQIRRQLGKERVPLRLPIQVASLDLHLAFGPVHDIALAFHVQHVGHIFRVTLPALGVRKAKLGKPYQRGAIDEMALLVSPGTHRQHPIAGQLGDGRFQRRPNRPEDLLDRRGQLRLHLAVRQVWFWFRLWWRRGRRWCV